MKKKVIISLAMILAVTASLTAATWTWSSTYDNVTHYRYQFNTDKADNWIVVGPYDTKKSFDVPAGTSVYVQQSVDGGKTWSKSGYAVYDPATAEPLYPEKEEEIAPVDPLPLLREEQERAEAKENGKTEKAPKTPGNELPKYSRSVKRSSRFALAFRIPSVALDPLSKAPMDFDQYAGLQLRFKNVYSPNSWFGLHIVTDIDFGMLSADGFPKEPWTETEKALGLDLGIQMSFLAGRKVDIYTGPAIGVDLLMNADGKTPVVDSCWKIPGMIEPAPIFGLPDFRMGATLYAAWDLGFEYVFNPVFSVGIGARYKYWFEDFKNMKDNRMTVGADLQISFTF